MLKSNRRDSYTVKRSSANRNEKELEKLKLNHEAEMKMIKAAAAKLKSRKISLFGSLLGAASNIRMYDTHIPGFCYKRNGEYRNPSVIADFSHLNDEKKVRQIEDILFTNGELDLNKMLCLHLLSTHVQKRKHIASYDGVPCPFIKYKNVQARRGSLSIPSVIKQTSKDFVLLEETLPRYVLITPSPETLYSSMSSSRTFKSNNSSHDEFKWKKNSQQIPVYFNNEISTILSSVCEALAKVNSQKLEELKEVARDPDRLREILQDETLHDFIQTLMRNAMLVKGACYEYIMAYPCTEDVTEDMVLVADILEVEYDPDLKVLLADIRQSIVKRHLEIGSLETRRRSPVFHPETDRPTTSRLNSESSAAKSENSKTEESELGSRNSSRKDSGNKRKHYSEDKGTGNVKRSICTACSSDWREDLERRAVYAAQRKITPLLKFTVEQSSQTNTSKNKIKNSKNVQLPMDVVEDNQKQKS